MNFVKTLIATTLILPTIAFANPCLAGACITCANDWTYLVDNNYKPSYQRYDCNGIDFNTVNAPGILKTPNATSGLCYLYNSKQGISITWIKQPKNPPTAVTCNRNG